MDGLVCGHDIQDSMLVDIDGKTKLSL